MEEAIASAGPWAAADPDKLRRRREDAGGLCGGGGQHARSGYGGRPRRGGDTFAAEESEDGSTITYVYSGLVSGNKEAEIYVDALTADGSCSVIDESGIIQDPPDFSAEEGSVLVGKNTQAEDGILEVGLQWTPTAAR